MRRVGSRARRERPGEGEPSWVEVSTAPPRRHCPPRGLLGAEGAAPGLLSNILEGGVFSLRWEGHMGGIFAADWCKSYDRWLLLSKEGWSVEGRSPANQHTLFTIPESNSPPLETTPPTSNCLSLEDFPECLQ